MRRSLSVRLQATLAAFPNLLDCMQRGVEKEGLRVDAAGLISQTDHPAALGCTLTHPCITTDYAEPLLELITPVCRSVPELLEWLDHIHRFVHQNMATDEVLWNASMPCRLQGEQSIRIAEYGASNAGRLRHVYRKGLEVRYGRIMQSIAGVHYNWSVDDTFWRSYAELRGEKDDQAFRSRHYFGLIRNYRRWSWLLMYLFGASPALDRSFLSRPVAGLAALDTDTLASRFATSLRMGDLGYRNDAQSGLFVCFNHLDTYVATLDRALHTPHPPYEKIGTHRDGQLIQLNTNVLQIENEYYNSIRPKRVTLPGERPLQALTRRGVQYVEVRCLDINPFAPLGIDATQIRFLDVFLLACLLAPSSLLDDSECNTVQDNFNQVVSRGRQEGLQLIDDAGDRAAVPLRDWAAEILDDLLVVAEYLDRQAGTPLHAEAIAWAREVLARPDQVRSAAILEQLSSSSLSHVEWVARQSMAFRDAARQRPLPEPVAARFEQLVRDSWAEEETLRLSDELPFDEYLRRFLQ